MTPRQIAFLFSFPANSKSLPAHAPATNNRTVCRNHFNPYLFIYKLYCFLFLLNPWRSEDDAERTRSFEKVTIVDDVRVVYTTVLMRFEKVDAVARCVYCVCVYSVGQSVCLHDYLVMKYSPKREEKKNSKPALLLLLPPPSCLYKRVTLKDWERKRRRGTHSRQRRKKKDFFKNLK